MKADLATTHALTKDGVRFVFATENVALGTSGKDAPVTKGVQATMRALSSMNTVRRVSALQCKNPARIAMMDCLAPLVKRSRLMVRVGEEPLLAMSKLSGSNARSHFVTKKLVARFRTAEKVLSAMMETRRRSMTSVWLGSARERLLRTTYPR